MSNTSDNQQSGSSSGSNKRNQRSTQNRNQNQQHHSNRIYTRHNDQRLQYRKNDHHPANNIQGQKSSRNNSSEMLLNQRQRQRLTSSISIGDASKICICCCHELRTYVYYSCMHYVCLNCSIKMRVLCEKTDCPVCRQESRRVYCTKNQLEPGGESLSAASAVDGASGCLFDKLIDKLGEENCLKDPQSAIVAGVYFDSEEIRSECQDLMTSQCSICTKDGRCENFKTIDELDKHMRKVHHRYFCELCLDNLKLFSFERKHYDREGLAQHKRLGDKDDYSFKGHPLCEYCDQRFFDKDVLYRHFRKEHYYCHFCDTDGHEEYYKDYAQLRLHFLKCHYLCELDDCSANAAQTHEYVVFRSELDFQAHKKQKHAKSKSDARAFGKLNIEFNMTNSARDRQQQKRRGGASALTFQDYDESNYKGSTRAQQSLRLEESEMDASVLRASREQYEAEEAERKRKNRMELIRVQHQKYEESLQQQKTKETKKPVESTTASYSGVAAAAATTTESNEPAQQQPTHWRNIIGGGNVPKINKDAEFPCLIGDESTKLLSLAELGATISASSSTSRFNNVWNSSKSPSTERTIPKSSSSKKTASPPEFTTEDSEEVLEKKIPIFSKNVDKKKKGQKKETSKNDERTKKAIENVKNGNETHLTDDLSSPPPGFESFKPTPLLAEQSTGFLSTSISNKHEYIKPVEYEIRNQELKSKLMDLFDKKSFNEFMTLSIDFRNSCLSAEKYLDKCMSLLDFSPPNNSELLKFLDLVQEMIILLPNVEKQSQLYSEFERLNQNLSSTKQTQEVSTGLKIVKCEVCKQYLLKDEITYHKMLNHPKEVTINNLKENNKAQQKNENDDEFPSLASSFTSKINFTATNNLGIIKKTEPQNEEFPPLGNGPVSKDENRFSTMPTASLFSNPSSHLSLANKKKHRLQK